MDNRIKLFLKFPEYRKMKLKYLWLNFCRKVTLPVRLLKSRVKAQKFLKEHPNRWERYVEIKETEKKVAEDERYLKLTDLRMSITHNLTQMQIRMLVYIAKTNPTFDVEKAKQTPLEQIKNSFTEYQKLALNSIEECEKLGAIVPEELFKEIQNCNYNSFHSVTELRAFSYKLRELEEMFDYGKLKE